GRTLVRPQAPLCRRASSHWAYAPNTCAWPISVLPAWSRPRSKRCRTSEPAICSPPASGSTCCEPACRWSRIRPRRERWQVSPCWGRIPASIKTRSSSHESIREAGQSEGLVVDIASVSVCGVLGHHPADDGRELFRAGCLLADTRRLRGNRMVHQRDARRGPACCLAATAGLFAVRACHRDSAGSAVGAVHAGCGLARLGRARHGGLVPAYSLER